jgi:hypothetical protein
MKDPREAVFKVILNLNTRKGEKKFRRGEMCREGRVWQVGVLIAVCYGKKSRSLALLGMTIFGIGGGFGIAKGSMNPED